jgi:hypothetical protein
VPARLIRGIRLSPLAPAALLALALGCAGGKDATGPSLGVLAVSVVGLPPGTAPSILVSGPDSFSHPVTTSSATLADLTPGAYTVAATTVTLGGSVYSASPLSQVAQVTAGGNATATVNYVAAPGLLNLTVSGLPGGVPAALTVSGPGGYSSSQTGSASLASLAPGSYAVAAAAVGDAGTTYDPSPLTQNVAVSSNTAAAAAVTYVVHSSATLNLRIDGFYVTQSVQTYARSVPLVAGRGGFLRVFVLANQANTATPEVRARFYKAGVLLQTLTIAAPSSGVPTDTVGSQGALSRTWNAALPSSLLQTGLQVVLDVDPTNQVPESSDADNSYPANATPLDLNVRTAANLNLRFVPVLRTADGTTGGVTGANAAQYADQTVRMHPLAVVNVDVRAPYTYSDTAQIQSNDGNGVWLRILSQINALQAAEGGTTNYYGVISTPYNSGIAGYGYVPGRAAVGWDKLPSASGVTAHELGHNFGRQHAPCGGAGSPDPNYPYAGGVTGQWGYDLVAGVLKPPTSSDLMGYCSSPWISDYNYSAVLSARGAAPGVVQVSAAREPSLIVWGRIHDGAVILEPAFEATTEARLPLAAGPNLLQGFDAQGGEAFRLAFSGTRVADAPNDEEQFAFAVPLRMVRGTLARLRLQARGRQVELRGTGALATGAPQSLRLERRGGRATVRWDPAAYPLAVIRDAATGRILSLAHDGHVTLDAAGALDVTLSDRARSITERLR